MQLIKDAVWGHEVGVSLGTYNGSLRVIDAVAVTAAAAAEAAAVASACAHSKGRSGVSLFLFLRHESSFCRFLFS